MENSIDVILEKYLGFISPYLNIILGVIMVIYGYTLFKRKSTQNSKAKKRLGIVFVVVGFASLFLSTLIIYYR